MLDFVSAHGHYIELVQAFAEHAEDLSPEDFLEIAEDGWKLFNCLTDEELAQIPGEPRTLHGPVAPCQERRGHSSKNNPPGRPTPSIVVPGKPGTHGARGGVSTSTTEGRIEAVATSAPHCGYRLSPVRRKELPRRATFSSPRAPSKMPQRFRCAYLGSMPDACLAGK